MLAGRLSRELPTQVEGAGNATNPKVGCELQQRPRRRSGGSRRGGEKPRGRNVTLPMAREGRRRGVSASRWEWTDRAENRRRGPRGGDVTESTDGRRGEIWLHRRICPATSTSAREVMQSSQRARVVGLMETSGGRVRVGEAASDGGGTRRQRDDAFGDRRVRGKTSNARPATAKATEGAGKANDSLPRARRG